jgi:hypothetical protein
MYECHTGLCVCLERLAVVRAHACAFHVEWIALCVPLSIAAIRPAGIATRVASAGRRCVSLFQQVYAQRHEVMGCGLRNLTKRVL